MLAREYHKDELVEKFMGPAKGTYGDIAIQTGVSPKHAKQILERACEKLREGLRKKGWDV